MRRAIAEIKHYGWTLLLLLAGLVVDAVPRRYLTDDFVRWYNESPSNWTWESSS